MSFRRLAAVFRVEFTHSFRRPLFVILAVMIALSAYGLSSGHMQISSGDSAVGGTKAWITSEFAQTQTMAFLTLLYYAFFLAIAAGLTLPRDRESKVDVLLHSTPLTAGEYVWGRFLAVAASFGLMMAWQAMSSAFFNHAVPNPDAAEIRGPFALAHYLKPVVTFGLPFVVFYAGVSLYLGQRTGNAVLVFVVPVATLLVCGFFLWTWAPSWLDARLNQLLQVLEPAGYRWLNETHLKVDRGVAFYNTHPVPYDLLFGLNRAWLLAAGLGAVVATQRRVAAARRGVEAARGAAAKALASGGTETIPGAPAAGEPSAPGAGLAALGRSGRAPSMLRGVRAVAGAELRELSRQAGLYIFVPLILLQCLGNSLSAVGVFDTPLLLTPGTTAVAVANQVSLLVCLLLLFYTVESLERERANGLAPILYATPLKTAALIVGKGLANSVVGASVLLGALLGCMIALAIQGSVPFTLRPYVLIWGLLLIPTFLAWTAFVTAVYAAVGNRYGAYALALAALVFTGYRALTGGMSWAGNWPLWGALRWSDLGFFETDRTALILNRILVLGLAGFFTALSLRLFERRAADAVRRMHALAPGNLARTGLRLAPFALVPLAAAIALVFQVGNGLGGGAAKKAEKDYWAKNLKTWMDAPLPDIARADIRLTVDPPRHWLRSEGTFTLVNPSDTPLSSVPVTGGRHWTRLSWTMNGRSYEPADDLRLYVFTPSRPLARGDSLAIGWRWEGRFPGGVTKNGGNTDEFILPSGVVLTGFTPSFAPVLGFKEDVGESKENKTEPRRYPRDFWRGVTRAGYGATAWFPARVSITGPAEYTLNSVGVCTSNSVTNGRRTQVWETDHPVKLLNVIAGRWKAKRGRGTIVYHHPGHALNVDEMSATLDAARRWYSEWFLPYPWRELKLSEFPALAGYAQGFGTNITFSETMGFLTKNDSKRNAAFLVTAHEAAHQWWGNILTPADGPSGDFLSEGMSHFSTLLLFEAVKGPRARMEFAKGIEARYADRRRVDDERPMYEIDGSKQADETVIYDRGGWVFWMLYDFLGHERAIEGFRNFIQVWSAGRDHPALADFVGAMRPYAADPAAYDAFVRQWMEDRAMPEYRIARVRKVPRGTGYDVLVTVRNQGTGTMPVEIAATAGDRWPAAEEAASGAGGERPRPEREVSYREAREIAILGAGDSTTVALRCSFRPEAVVVDPDVRILQLNRKLAHARVP